ncbi:MAG: hypothetical protein IJ690_04995 [Clostridia bacterium]|nr:hypothetical protein [Clostridia bacterium]
MTLKFKDIKTFLTSPVTPLFNRVARVTKLENGDTSVNVPLNHPLAFYMNLSDVKIGDFHCKLMSFKELTLNASEPNLIEILEECNFQVDVSA